MLWGKCRTVVTCDQIIVTLKLFCTQTMTPGLHQAAKHGGALINP